MILTKVQLLARRVGLPVLIGTPEFQFIADLLDTADDLEARLASAEAATQAAAVEMKEACAKVVETLQMPPRKAATIEDLEKILANPVDPKEKVTIYPDGSIGVGPSPILIMASDAIRALPIPTAALELDRAKVRLSEAKWWEEHSYFSGALIAQKDRRIADLNRQLAAQVEKGGDRT